MLPEDGEKAKSLPQDMETERDYKQDCSYENHTYHVGEFVYVEPSEPNLKPHIVCIERLWEDEEGKTLYRVDAKKNTHKLTTNTRCVFM